MKNKTETQEIKEQIINKLENKTSNIFAEEYVEAEQKLLNKLEELEGWGGECNCDDREIIRIINVNDFDEISTYCLNCGGYVTETEWK